VTCQIVERNDWLETAGLGEISYAASVFTFNQAGQIEKITPGPIVSGILKKRTAITWRRPRPRWRMVPQGKTCL
jgi:hypothetical protein